uniref:Voltage-gated potassium channel n=1 Tax=Tetraselmis sp. GSL018 TaxID=582737 RepID=A0A061S3N4_9CHLO
MLYTVPTCNLFLSGYGPDSIGRQSCPPLVSRRYSPVLCKSNSARRERSAARKGLKAQKGLRGSSNSQRRDELETVRREAQQANSSKSPRQAQPSGQQKRFSFGEEGPIPVSILSKLSFDEAGYSSDIEEQSELPMSRMLQKIVRSDIVLLLDILGTLLLCACFALDTLPLTAFEKAVVSGIEIDTTIYFTILYFARWYVKGLSLGYLIRPLSMIDLVSLLPLLLGTEFRAAAFLRVLRILKIARLLQGKEMSQLATLLTRRPVTVRNYQQTIVQAGFTVFSFIFVTAGVVYELETSAGLSTFGSFFDALYFAITTLTSVGFGDVVPGSAGGKAFVSVAILAYAVLVPYELALLAQSLGLMGRSDNGDEPSGGAGSPQPREALILRCKQCGADGHQADALYCRKCGSYLKL